jgi:hypothetical protein
MPGFTLYGSHGCDISGAGFVRLNGLSGLSYGPYEYVMDGALAVSAAFDPDDMPLTIGSVPNGTVTVYARDVATGAVTPTLTFVIGCTPITPDPSCDLADIYMAWTDESGVGDAYGRLYFGTTAGDGQAQISINTPVTLGDGYHASGTHTGDYTSGNTYTIYLSDRDGCLSQLTFVAPTYGCTDENADNYNPAATLENLTCTYSPKVELSGTLPALAPNGVPLVVVFQSQAISGATPAPAECVINLEALGLALVTLTINAYTLRSGPLTVPGRFSDALTLVEALRAIPALEAAYLIRLSGDEEVKLTARAQGTAWNLTPTTTDAVATVITTTAAVNQYHSQRRSAWGLWVEVWAGCGSEFGAATTKASAVLADAYELPYRSDNRYEFDIATALRRFTGHAYPLEDGTMPDRLVSYFLKFGESYADTAGGLRRVRTRYETDVAWGLEAMEVPAPQMEGVYFLSTRPTTSPKPWLVGSTPAIGALISADLLPVVAPYFLTPLVNGRAFDGTASTSQYDIDATFRGPRMMPTDAALLYDDSDALSSDFVLIHPDHGTYSRVLTFRAVVGPCPALRFVNRQGSTEVELFEGNREEATKRTAGTFQNARGTQQLSAEAALPFRLYTGPLDRATWDWLRAELAVSPAVWLEPTAAEAEAGVEPVAVRVTDIDPLSDHQKGEYSLSVELETEPVRGLSN